MSYTIRRMREEDIPQVVEIEKIAFSRPWTKSIFKAVLLLPYAAYYVAVEDSADAEEAAGRVSAVKEQVSKIAKEREKGGWRNQNGERILHPQQHLIGTFVGLARKIQYQPPHITHEELEREVFDPANKHRLSGALNPLGFIADDSDTDAFWCWLVAHDFKNSNHEVITRKNIWGTLHAFMALQKKDLIDFFADGCRTRTP